MSHHGNHRPRPLGHFLVPKKHRANATPEAVLEPRSDQHAKENVENHAERVDNPLAAVENLHNIREGTQ